LAVFKKDGTDKSILDDLFNAKEALKKSKDELDKLEVKSNRRPDSELCCDSCFHRREKMETTTHRLQLKVWA
jgi:hypothetical protein